MNAAENPIPHKARVLVVDDHPMMREGLVQFINRQDGIFVCGQADGIASAQFAIEQEKPDLLLLDLRLGTGDTIDFIKTLKTEYPALRILVFSQFDETIFAEKALKAGAKGYVMKQEATEEVLTAIRIILQGDMYVSRHIALEFFQRSLEDPAPESIAIRNAENEIAKLTDRELHVFQLIGSGFSTRRVADEMGLSIKTVESHREHIKHKLNLSNGAELHQRATEWVGKHLLPREFGDVLVSTVWKT